MRGEAAVLKRVQVREWQRGGCSRESSAVQSALFVPVGSGGCMWVAGKVLHGSAFLPGFGCVQGPICLRSVARFLVDF